MSDDRPLILIVDDQPESLLLLEEALGEHYRVSTFTDGEGVLAYFSSGGTADLLLLDIILPGLSGFAVCRLLKAAEATHDLPILFLTSLDQEADEAYGLSLGAGDFIHKPASAPVVLARVGNHLTLARYTRMLKDRNQDLEREVVARTADIRRGAEELVRRERQVIAVQDATIMAFCALAEARDYETGNHIRRTQHYIRVLAEALRHHPRFERTLDDETIRLLFKSAPLHDIGKVAIPDAILLKPGGLSPEEWAIMKTHCRHGRDAIESAEREMGDEPLPFLCLAKEIAYGHHERWDGSGYPEGLAGDAIPVSARLMAAADVYDALISRRVYKPPLPHEQAIEMMLAERGRHFDPDVADALRDLAGEFQGIARRFIDL